MKYLQQFLLILCISFVGEFLKYVLPLPIPASIYGMVILFIGLLTGLIKLEQVKDVGEVPDRDHACYVHSGGCWADGVLGNVETVCTACQCHYCYHDRDGHGSNRNLFTMGDPERKKAGRGCST